MMFGSHVSIRDGYLGAAKRAKELHAQTFQYFTKNPRSLSIKDFDMSDAELCKEYCTEQQLVSISHSPYPTNLTPKTDKEDSVVHSLLNDLEISETCGSIGVVVHFGKESIKENPIASYELMIAILNKVLTRWDGSCKILLENNAGLPGTMGTTFEELTQIAKLSDYPEKIGFCLDTCHAFSSGLWNGDNWEDVEEKGEELNFFKKLEAVHLNNSKYPTGEGKDRHANIFKGGYIKINQWKSLIKSSQLQGVPFILETPDDMGINHKQEINQLYTTLG